MPTKNQAKDPTLYLITGDDDYLIDEKARSLVEALCPKEEQAFGLEIIEPQGTTVEDAAAAFARCMEAVQTVGFFGGRKVVWFRNAPLGADALKAEDVKKRLDTLTNLIRKGLPAEQVLVLSAIKVDGRSAFFKVCKELADITEFKTPEKAREADQAVLERAGSIWKELGMRPAGASVLEGFVARVGTDTRLLKQESDKLATYLGGTDAKVTEADVTAVVSAARESMAWDLADRIGERRLDEALWTIRQLLFQGESGVGLLFGVESRIRDLLLLRECARKKWVRLEGSGYYQKLVWEVPPEVDEALAAFSRDPRKGHPYRAVKLFEQAMKYSLAELLDAQRLLAEVHEQLVSSSLPVGVALEILILRIVGQEEKAGVA